MAKDYTLKKWSTELRERTWTEIAEMLTCGDPDNPDGEPYWVIGASLLRYARLKCIDGTLGKMTVENALQNRYIIHCEGGAVRQFATVDELIDAGWVLD